MLPPVNRNGVNYHLLNISSRTPAPEMERNLVVEDSAQREAVEELKE